MDAIEKIKSLDIWKNDLTINPLEGGITNLNFLVNHGDQKLVVRLGQDIPEHLVFRSNEINVSKANILFPREQNEMVDSVKL